MFLNGAAEKNFNKLKSFNLTQYLILAKSKQTKFSENLAKESLINTDIRKQNNKSVSPGFLFAALLWNEILNKSVRNGEINLRLFFRSMDQVLRQQQKITAIPRKFHTYIKDIWVLQLKLHSRIGKQPYKTLKHPRFRAAYDFLLLREKACKVKSEVGGWWTDFQKNDPTLRKKLIANIQEKNFEETYKKFGFSEELR